jgi:RHH-type proline utilization regulon transcriptional repressor/proline dehydrogenase/delta 1-pyrroline-5-carboxylate dehydrogenase
LSQESEPLVVDREDVERRTQEIGRALFARIGAGSRPWERGWWDDQFMAVTMNDPQTKVQLFRFIDALPALKSPKSVRGHLEEYLDEAGDRVPTLVRLPLAVAPRGSLGDAILAHTARLGATRMAKRFIAGATPEEALVTVKRLRTKRLAFTADLLGEAVISDVEAEAYQKTCIDLVRGLAGPLGSEPEVPQIDRNAAGPIPRVNLSLKLTSLIAHFDALHAEATTARVLERLRPILRVAKELGAFVNVDMEQYTHKDLTYEIFRSVLLEPEFRDWADAGIVCQAYLPEAMGDLEQLLAWSQNRGTPVTVRLVKGAYWDYEVLHARQLGWPVPVYEQKWATDANYERCARYLMEHAGDLRPALGSHNVRSLAAAISVAEALGVPRQTYEVQMLYGMAEPIQRAIVEQGYRVRVYTPYGAMLPGMAYLVRRLLENTSNESFLKASTAENVPVADLLRDPEESGAMLGRKSRSQPGKVPPADLPPFTNEPPTDFTRPAARAAMSLALEQVRSRLQSGAERRDGVNGDSRTDGTALLRCVPWIGGEARETGGRNGTETVIPNRDPNDTNRIVSTARYATLDETALAIDVARRAFPEWSATPPRERAEVLVRAAEIMRKRRFELAAWEVFECGKPWREADADVAEAIDFCEFYAREMIRLAAPRKRDVPGETNAIERLARGVAVVIPPWNFPLAIPTGMTVAALVAGNTVILKPAEQSPAICWHLAQILHQAGLPAGALSYLPGAAEVGRALVENPKVDLIAFTGSREVGLEINRNAANTKPGQDHVKRVIAEMGGKNAIIVDDDADLDEAVTGVLYSAFGYAGQKCSACSRVIVLDGVYDAFVTRLSEAVHALPVGSAEDPDTYVGPVVSAEARDRVQAYQKVAEAEGRVVARVSIGTLAEKGYYLGPLIVADVSPSARIAQEEVFGPILAVLRARDLDDGLQSANGTEYALTGGLYSRSPAHIDRVKRDYRVGNLYINRPITGALVDRQPFGGFKLSGIGTKAGGPEYLLEFLLTRTITENTMRRGFAPEEFDGSFAVGTQASAGS